MDVTPRGFKKPLATELYDINIVNFNTDLTDNLVGKVLDNKVEVTNTAPTNTILWLDTTVE